MFIFYGLRTWFFHILLFFLTQFIVQILLKLVFLLEEKIEDVFVSLPIVFQVWLGVVSVSLVRCLPRCFS